MRGKPVLREIDALVREWKDDPDTNTAEYTLVQIDMILCRVYGRKLVTFNDEEPGYDT